MVSPGSVSGWIDRLKAGDGALPLARKALEIRGQILGENCFEATLTDDWPTLVLLLRALNERAGRLLRWRRLQGGVAVPGKGPRARPQPPGIVGRLRPQRRRPLRRGIQ